MCVREEIGVPSMLRLIRWTVTVHCGLDEDVADSRFELGVKSNATEAELVLDVL